METKNAGTGPLGLAQSDLEAEPPVLNSAQRRLVRREMTIATCACALVPTLLVALLFEPFPVPVLGLEGLIGFALKSTLIPVLLMASLMTLGTRAQVRKGAVPQLDRKRLAWLALAPRSIWLRAPIFAIGAALIIASLTAAWADAVGLAGLQRPGFLLFNFVVGVAIGLCMTPLIQCAALADGADASSQSASPAEP